MLGAIAAYLFEWVLAFSHHLFFWESINVSKSDLLHTQSSSLQAGIIFVPVMGAWLVVFLLSHFAPKEKGLSVPELMYSLRHQGKIDAVSAFIKALASAITISTGGSVGREGPIIQMGAAISSVLGVWVKLPAQSRIVLMAAGSAAMVSTTFNAPLAGMAFALELLLPVMDVWSVVSVISASLIATYVKYFYLDPLPIFKFVTLFHLHSFYSPVEIVIVIPFGILLGILSAIFITGLYWCEDRFEILFPNLYLRHTVGMLLVGVMIFLMMYFYGHYYIEGIGFSTIQDCLNFMIKNPWLLCLLLIGKCLATFFTLGSGGPGGVFSPLLFLGAVAGALVFVFFNSHVPTLFDNPLIFVLAGMAAMLASGTGAIFTSVLLVLELTHEYAAILPVLLTVMIACLVRRLFCSESVYTLKLVRKGIHFEDKKVVSLKP